MSGEITPKRVVQKTGSTSGHRFTGNPTQPASLQKSKAQALALVPSPNQETGPFF